MPKRRKVSPSARQWERIRREVFERDGYRCQKCGKAGRLEAHHVVHLAAGGGNAVENVQTLCRGCHIAHHGGPVAEEQAGWDKLIARI